MRRIIAVYQGQDPGDQGPNEHIAVHDHDGWSVVHARLLKNTGKTSHGQTANDNLVMFHADSDAKGYFQTSIEPYGDQWQLTCYEHGQVNPLDESVHKDVNKAMLEGRLWLNRACKEESLATGGRSES